MISQIQYIKHPSNNDITLETEFYFYLAKDPSENSSIEILNTYDTTTGEEYILNWKEEDSIIQELWKLHYKLKYDKTS